MKQTHSKSITRIVLTIVLLLVKKVIYTFTIVSAITANGEEWTANILVR